MRARATLPRPRIQRVRRPQLERSTPLVAIAVARQVVEEPSGYLRTPLADRYAAGLAHHARHIFAHSPQFREKMLRPGDRGRDLLHVFMRHRLAARFYSERFDLYRRLPAGYCTGAPLPEDPPADRFEENELRFAADDRPISPDARLLAEV